MIFTLTTTSQNHQITEPKTINIETLEDLKKLQNEHEALLILDFNEPASIEIYDDYRE